METTVLPQVVEPLLKTPLTIQQLKVLLILVTEVDENTVQGLATLLDVSLATMSGILDRLSNHGMVQRSSDVHDQRVRRINATADGRAAIRSLMLAQSTMDVGPLGRLTTDELRALAVGMSAYLREAAVQVQGEPRAEE
nr:MarR family transcriptional regulator [Lysinibacter cavernae]